MGATMSKKGTTIVITVIAGLIAVVTGAMKCADAFDYFLDRAKPIQAIREKAIAQDGEIKSVREIVGDVKEDTNAIREALGVPRRHRRHQEP